MIPIIIAPGIWRIYREAMIKNPANANNDDFEPTSPKPTKVAWLATIIPEFCKAIIARNKPIPTEIAYLSERGILLIIHLRVLNTLNNTNKIPDQKIHPKAICQL